MQLCKPHVKGAEIPQLMPVGWEIEMEMRTQPRTGVKLFNKAGAKEQSSKSKKSSVQCHCLPLLQGEASFTHAFRVIESLFPCRSQVKHWVYLLRSTISSSSITKTKQDIRIYGFYTGAHQYKLLGCMPYHISDQEA